MAKNFAEFFSINERDQVNISLRSTTADKTMLFSGPPTFAALGEINDSTTSPSSTHILTPLVFTTTFAVMNNRTPGRELPVLSTSDTFSEPSPGGTIALQMGSYSIISGDPLEESSNTKYNLVKRLYNDIIHYNDGELVKFFLTENTDNNGFKPIAANIGDLYTGFAKSEFYDMKFGILRITLTKGNEQVLIHYFEHCKAVRGFNEQAQAGGASNFQTSIQISAADEIPLSWDDVAGAFEADGSDSKAFFDAYLKYVQGTD